MRIDPGELDRRIAIWRADSVDDGTATVAGEPTEIGKRWARKTDVSDGERSRAGENAASLGSRWLVQSDSLTATINPATDVIRYRDRVYEITGVKEAGDREDGIEITTAARSDQRP